MKKNIGKLLVLLMLLTTVLTACGSKENKSTSSDSKEAETTLHLVTAHNQTSTDNPYQVGLVKFKEYVEEASGGKITVEVHNGSIGTNESELVEKLSLGAADIVIASPAFMTSVGVNEIDMLSLLYLWDNFDHWNNNLTGEFGDKMKEIINEKTNNQFKVISYWSSGVRNFYGKKPLVEPEDAKGLKIRTQNSQVQKAFWESCGAIPTPVDWNELYQALQQGVVDGSENDYTNLMQKDHHKTKNGHYISETAHDYTTRLVLMNGSKFDSLTDEQKTLITEAMNKATNDEIAEVKRMLEESKNKVIADGAEVVEPNVEAFKKLALPIQDEFAKKNNMEDLLNMVRNSK